MPKGTNQKFKLYFLMKIMLEKTDEEHYITMPQILAELVKYGVTAERKSIYTDFDALEKLGVEVIGEPVGSTYHYRVSSRQFELAELKLLVDTIQSSKFITARKSRELIRKLEGFCSEHEAKKLQRQVYVSGRIKTMNESIYYNVDAIHNAIGENRKIRFQYYQWNLKKEMELRHSGAYYHISPWGLSWDDENYYLVGYDSKDQIIKHYRVDKMLKIRMSEEEREGKEFFEQVDIASYTRKNFAMFGGKEERVKLLMENQMAGVVIDRFGKDTSMIPTDETHFTVNVDVAVSQQFFAWVFALGNGAKILGPENVVEQAKQEIKRLMKQYHL
ncbi:MAG: WYL domain-containing protein [Lachnospiraceae bacterium]|nr:WYL domain-containing protein [Lachnospiraceae bacterium]